MCAVKNKYETFYLIIVVYYVHYNTNYIYFTQVVTSQESQKVDQVHILWSITVFLNQGTPIGP